MTGGELIIISAPSGAGKTSLVNAVVDQLDSIEISISYTTRPPRPQEQNHRDYVFLDEKTFLEYKTKGHFLEDAKVFQYYYGTSREWVLERLSAGIDVILEIDWQGAGIVKAKLPCVSIFLLPPSTQALRSRLLNRDQDDETVIDYRMQRAHEEMSHYADYDFLVINDDFERATADLSAIIQARRLITQRQQQTNQLLIEQLLSNK